MEEIVIEPYRVFIFFNGGCIRVYEDAQSVEHAIELACAPRKIDKQKIVFLSTIKVKAQSPSKRERQHDVTHELEELEFERPDLFFVAAVKVDDLRRMEREANAGLDAHYEAVQKRIDAVQSQTRTRVGFDDLPTLTRSKIAIGPNGCWIWKGLYSPYKRLYEQYKGPIPKDAHLLHGCHNGPECVNLNHIVLGTHRENVRQRDALAHHGRYRKALKTDPAVNAPKAESKILIARKINTFITRMKPKAICDSCIADALRLTRQALASQITVALGTTSDFEVEVGECSICRKKRVLIYAS